MDYMNGLPSFLTASCVVLLNGQQGEKEGSIDSPAPLCDIAKDLGTWHYV